MKGKPGTASAAAVNGSLTGADISGQTGDSTLGQPFVEGSLTGQDVATGSITGSDVATNSVTGLDITSLSGADVIDSGLTGADIQEGTLAGSDIADATLRGIDVGFNSLTGDDIDESTLVGVKDGDSCISGALLFGRLCAGSDGVNRNLFAAFNFCATIGLRLPTWGEAVLLAVNHDVAGVGAFPAQFWTDEIADELTPENNFSVIIVDENGNGDAVVASNSVETVCVTNPD